MMPQKQLYRHEPENGRNGDCHRTAVACMLDLAVEEVPHFFAEVDPKDKDLAWDAQQAWFAARGEVLLSIPYNGKDLSLQEILDTMRITNPGVHYLLGGESKTGVGHTVVCKDNAVVHDPSLDDSGIVGPMEDGCYWVSFIGRLV